MKYRRLGRTELMVSEVGFGAWAIGGHGWGPTDDSESLAALRRAFELGVNFIDTADVYGAGHSEQVIGEAIKGKREKFIVATKFGNDFYGRLEGKYDLRADFSAGYTLSAVEKSLSRLKTDYIDLIQLHATRVPGAEQVEAFDALEKMKEQGKVRFIGVSVKSVQDALDCINGGRADTVQLVYNMLQQDMAKEALPLAQEKDVGVIAREPLRSGLLAAKWNADWEFHPHDFRRYRFRGERFEKALGIVEELKFLLGTGSNTMAQAAIRFVLSHPAVSVVIPGGRRPSQVEDNVSASDAGPLSEDELRRISRIVPQDLPEDAD